MATIEFDKLFEPSNKSVLDFYQQSGVGLYIPEYQRGYSWDKENVYQLLSDISQGVQHLADVNNEDSEIHFLGTLIVVTDKVGQNKDPKGKPTRTDIIIDGQQRITTISIVVSIMIKKLIEFLSKMKKGTPYYDSVKEIVDAWARRMINFISFDLMRGEPNLKPKTIRGGEDYWTMSDSIHKAYKSRQALYEALFIKAYLDYKEGNLNPKFPQFNSGQDGTFDGNGKFIDKWIRENILCAHKTDLDEYPNAEQLLDKGLEVELWDYSRQELTELVSEYKHDVENKDASLMCSLVQLLSAGYFLLNRCCFCVIKPANEDWAFDLFQSLNATGTPLTAFETFKPAVVNYLKSNNIEYKGSQVERDYNIIDSYLNKPTTASKKKSRTNEFLVSFFDAYDGRKLETHFSSERKALVDTYDKLKTSEEKDCFISQMSQYAQFFVRWNEFDSDHAFCYSVAADEQEKLNLCIALLKATNHKMAVTTLGTIYREILHEEKNAAQHFIETAKATTAFYYFWRTAFGNNGLDIAYRKFFKDCKDKNVRITSESIKEYFRNTLKNKSILDRDDWKGKAYDNLKYKQSNTDLIRFSLLVAFTDTIPDNDKKGMLKQSKDGTVEYLTYTNWNSESLRTIEHIAPQTNTDGRYDQELYDPSTNLYQSLGNLTLLPQDINSVVGNKPFSNKVFYYNYVAENDLDRINKLENDAISLGIVPNEETIQRLKNCKYGEHMKSICALGYHKDWNTDIVKGRTEVMMDAIWSNLHKWIL